MADMCFCVDDFRTYGILRVSVGLTYKERSTTRTLVESVSPTSII